MTEIASFDFDPNSLEKIREYKFGTDWPVNYLIEDGRELYVGQTVRAFYRAKQHLENENRRRLKKIHIISDNLLSGTNPNTYLAPPRCFSNTSDGVW